MDEPESATTAASTGVPRVCCAPRKCWKTLRPKVPATSVLEIRLSSRSRTCTIGRPTPKRFQASPPLVERKTPSSVPA
jgi:hypothetical protein